MNVEKPNHTPPAGSEQDTERATSGGGLGQGRETAGGWHEDTDIVGRPGKGMGGTDDTGGTSEQPTTPEESDTQPEQERSDNEGPMLPLDTKDQGMETA